jgi:hypothetical protein
MRTRKLVTVGAAMLWPLHTLYAQEPARQQGAIQAAVGLGLHQGQPEEGVGVLYSLGYQHALGTSRWRLNPHLVYGEFSSVGLTDTRDQFYRTTSAGLAVHYDVLQYRALAVVLSTGGFVTYARGLLGTGGEAQPAGQGSRYFHHFYLSGSGGLGLRVSPAQSRFAYELRPLTLHGGTNGFLLGAVTVGLAVNLHR